MNTHLEQIYSDQILIDRVKRKLPSLFQMAELESSRAGKIGMEVGSLREKIIIALLIYKFGEINIDTNLPITEPEVDVQLYNQPISIKTLTGNKYSGLKLIWTVDAESAINFQQNYEPTCDMIFIQIIWGATGTFNYIPLEAQQNVFNRLGRNEYIKLPKPGTNPRGVEMNSTALKAILDDQLTKRLQINWIKENVDFKPYKRWVELWQQE